MVSTSTLKRLSFSDGTRHVQQGAAFVDLRAVASYLDVHIPASLSLAYEDGPGFQSRARDCLPLDLPLILLDVEGVDMIAAAARLRGRGFSVPGSVADGINEWAGSQGPPASTETYRGPQPRNAVVLHVSDPGVGPLENVTHIPIEHLWGRVEEVAMEPRVIVASGYGVRAALAVGILERAGVPDVIVWNVRGS